MLSAYVGLVVAFALIHFQPLKEISCAVMTGNRVEVAVATRHRQFADYKGRRYFFCCGACPAAFNNNPEKFAKNSSIPIPNEPHWENKEFISDVEKVLAEPTLKLKLAIEFIIAAPPKKQIIDGNGRLDWAPNKVRKTGAKLILHHVRQVRNYLFHGDKFNEHFFDPERSEPLMRHSLTILRACVDGVPKLHQAYHG